MLGGESDTVVFQGGVTSEDITISRNGASNDVIITIVSTGETLSLIGQVWYTSINYHPDQVDQLQFADGEIWTAAQLREQYLIDAKTSGNDAIYGFYSADLMDGGSGNDSLYGGDGSDTYLFGYGSGHDVIEELWNNVLYADVFLGPRGMRYIVLRTLALVDLTARCRHSRWGAAGSDKLAGRKGLVEVAAQQLLVGRGLELPRRGLGG